MAKYPPLDLPDHPNLTHSITNFARARSRRGLSGLRGHCIVSNRTLRDALRQGGDIQCIARLTPKPRWPNLAALCDISGSMSRYSRIILHFLHAVSNSKGTGWATPAGRTRLEIAGGVVWGRNWP